METMLITDVSHSKNAKIFGGFIIKTQSYDMIRIKSKLVVEYKNKNYYFEVVKIETTKPSSLLKIEAMETGYYNKFSEINKDIRDLYGLEIKLVTDQETIKQIEKESMYM